MAEQTQAKRTPDEWSVAELKAYLDIHSIDYSDCLEKSDFVAKVKGAILSHSPQQSAPSAQDTPPSTFEQPPQTQPSIPTGDSAASGSASQQPQPQQQQQQQQQRKPNYYDVLEIPKDATASQVTKAYYRLARMWHPDKNQDDPTAEDRFKLISEAYQVLSDPEKRANYDKFGTAEDINGDPKELFRMLFGAGRFDDLFKTPLAGFFDVEEGNEQTFQETFERTREQNTIELSEKLLALINKVITDSKASENKQAIVAEACELAEAPGGSELLYLVGYVYLQEAKQFSTSFLGIPAFFSELKEKGHLIKEAVSAMSSAVKMQQMQQEQERILQGGQPGGDAGASATGAAGPHGEAAMIQQGLKTIWKSGKLEIELNLRNVCENVLGQAVTKEVRQQRCRALKTIGEIFKKVAQAAMKAQPGNAGPPTL